MKKITAILLMALMVLSLTACGNQTGKDNNGSEGSTEPTSVTITTLNGQKEETQLEVPYNPERIAISLNLSYEADSLPPINIISGSHSITASISASFIVPRFFMFLFSE